MFLPMMSSYRLSYKTKHFFHLIKFVFKINYFITLFAREIISASAYEKQKFCPTSLKIYFLADILFSCISQNYKDKNIALCLLKNFVCELIQ